MMDEEQMLEVLEKMLCDNPGQIIEFIFEDGVYWAGDECGDELCVALDKLVSDNAA